MGIKELLHFFFSISLIEMESCMLKLEEKGLQITHW